MIGYYVFAVGVLVFTGYLSCRKNACELRATTDAAMARLRAAAATPDLTPEPAGDANPEPERSASGDTTLQHEYAAAVSGLRTVLRKMSNAGMGVTADRVAADVTAGDSLT